MIQLPFPQVGKVTKALLVLALLSCASSVFAQLARVANTTLNFPDALPVASSYTTQNALGSLTFAAPICTAFPIGETNRLFVAERGGQIQAVTSLSTSPIKSSYLALSSLLGSGETFRSDGENGFLSFTFHPNFANNRTLYLYFSIQRNGRLYQRLHQVTVTDASANTAVIQQHKPLLTILDRHTNHNGGDIHFGTDGFLYLSTGDEGDSNDSENNARHINHRNTGGINRTGFWGQILRIAVEVDPIGQPGVFPAGTEAPNAHVQNTPDYSSTALHGNYRVPIDNPFRGYTLWHSVVIDPLTVRTEIWATGLRNPFRWSFDPVTGRLFLGDVGQNDREELNIIAKGDDMGWSWREGAIPFLNSPRYPDNSTGTTNAAPAPPVSGAPPGTGFSPKAPIYDYDRTDNGTPNDAVVYGTTVTGGVVYRGGALTELYGKYIFAEYGSGGMIVALTEQSGGNWTGQRLAVESGIVDFGYDPRNGETIFCNIGTGRIKRLIRNVTTGTAPPAKLSDTGAFTAPVANLNPQPGLVAYAPNVNFWSDYASKSRWFAITNTTDTIGFSAEGNWTFPNKMVWIKHFDIETTRGNPATKRKLETRFIVKTATDIYGLSYKWKDDQSDADLVAEEGLTQLIPASSPAQTWRFPSRSECRTCHTAVGGFALSFNTRQMNREHPFGSISQNQIKALSDAGYFSAPVTGIHSLHAHAPAEDGNASLESRIRSYFSVNCVQCHQSGGTATGNWDARAATPTDAASLINGLLVNNSGDPANKFAVPGDLTHSMVLRRLQGSSGVQRMPPLATNELDPAAITLVTNWINSLLQRRNFAQWQIENFPSGGPNAAPGANPDGDALTNAGEFLANTDPNNAASTTNCGNIASNGTQLTIQFTQPANRSALIETTIDLTSNNWQLWDVPGNSPTFPATAQPRTLLAPLTETQRHFRLRLNEQ